MNINLSADKLGANAQALRQRWSDTQSVWNDPVSRAFEQEYLVPLENQTQATQREMERLAQVIAQAKHGVK